MKPFRIFIFFLSVLVLLSIVAVLFPEDGVRLGEQAGLRFFSLNTLVEEEKTGSEYTDSLIQNLEVDDDPEAPVTPRIPEDFRFDSLLLKTEAGEAVEALTDSMIRFRIDSISKNVFPIEYAGEFEEELRGFFTRAEKSTSNGEVLRILHYGDSQIENDRMTSRLRYRFQNVFGGSGCGLVPAIPLYFGNPVYKQSIEGDWLRYTGFGKRDSTLGHKEYGALVCFTSIPAVHEEVAPSLEFTFRSGRKASDFQSINLFLHAFKDSGYIDLMIDDSLAYRWEDIASGYQVLHYELERKALNIKMMFHLEEGGRIYGIGFDPKAGIQVDNAAMRGSSGTEFTRVDPFLLDTMINSLNPGLILMQFGGNVVPYIKNTAYYRKIFKRELIFLNELCPDIPIIVVGPSDMSTRENGAFVTYENLEPVRDALREAALESGCGFWDMYEAMGGERSIMHFVEADPPLAKPDYVHFTMRGANFMAGMFFDALMLEYQKYKSLK